MEKEEKIGQLLLKEGIIDEKQLKHALEMQENTYRGKALGEVLIREDIIKETDFLRILAKQFNTLYVITDTLADIDIPPGILKLVPEAICEKHILLPVRYAKKDKSLTIAIPNPMNVAAIDDVKFASGISNIRLLVALESTVKAGIDKFYKGNKRAFDYAIESPQETAGGDFQSMFDSMATREAETAIEPGEEGKDEVEGATREEEIPPQPEESVVLGGPKKSPGAGEPATATKVKEKAKEAKRYHRKVLVVDPRDNTRKFITALFDREGFEVKGAHTSQEALKEIEEEEYDVLVIQEKSMGEGTDFEEKVQELRPEIELSLIKDYSSAIIGETRLYHKLINSFFETLDVVVGLLEIDREQFQGHTHKVAKYSKLIAQKMGLPKRDIDETVLAAYAHDLGKKALRHETLLTLEEDLDKDTLKDTIDIPIKLLGGVSLVLDIKKVLESLFERYNGDGFPNGLKGDDIPIGARILAAVDAFEDLVSRGLKEGEPLEIADAMGVINEKTRTLFDPRIVEVFTQVVKDDLFLGGMGMAREHVLIADNEVDLTTLLELKFANTGYQVSIARNGEEALAKAIANPPDFILSEVDLPKLDGFAFIEKLKEEEGFADTPFVYVSKKDDSKLITRGFDLGAEDVVLKPVRVEALFIKIQKMMERIKRARKEVPKKAEGVSGSLSEMSLPDIVQILGAGRRTGLITITHDDKKAEIYLEEGRIVNAIYGDLKGEEAFYSIVSWEEGAFAITPDVEISERLITKTTDSLMLEGFRRLDEGSKETTPEDISLDESDDFF